MSPRIGSRLVTVVPGQTTGAEVLAMLREEAKVAGLSVSKMSEHVFGNASRWGSLGKTPVRPATVHRIVTWARSLPWSDELAGLPDLERASDALKNKSEERKESTEARVPGSHARAATTVEDLVRSINEFLERSGMGEFEFAQRALGWRSLGPIRCALTVQARTSERVLAFIAKDPEPVRKSAASPSAIASARMRDSSEQQHDDLNRRRALVDHAHETRAPGETIAERFRRLAAEVAGEEDAEEEVRRNARRDRELVEIPTPASLIRRAQQDWPDQCAKVAAFAAERGLSRGEVWRRVIAGGVNALGKGGE